MPFLVWQSSQRERERERERERGGLVFYFNSVFYANFVNHFCYVVMLSCLTIVAMWSPAAKGPTLAWLSCM